MALGRGSRRLHRQGHAADGARRRYHRHHRPAATSLFAFNHDFYVSRPILVADMRRNLQSGARPLDKRTKAFERVDSRPAATGDHHSLQAVE
jgi:hypothetical protein